MNEGNLKIKNVEVRGFGNIGHVVMRELGNRIILEGVNGVGKTMILTAIRASGF
jgi:recombinational DNA repair ATPase RecF